MLESVMVVANALIKVTPGLMIWTAVSFGLTLLVLWKFAFGPIQKAIDERREGIRKSIDEADRARDEGRLLLEEHRALIAQARSEAEGILAEARNDAEKARREGCLVHAQLQKLVEALREVKVSAEVAERSAKGVASKLSSSL